MSAITDKILLLGYPIDRIAKEALEETMQRLIESYIGDHVPKYATSVSALFLGQLSSLVLNNHTLPSVVTTLRQADFIGIDSKELGVLAKLLGNSLESLITPEDLLLANASLLSKYNQSIFLLSGKEDLCKQTAEALLGDFPGLKIAGIAAPNIHTKGLELEESIHTDDVIVEMINQASPTVLALNLGHPKQEIWFERIRHKIHVPLIIGVGGGFERYLSQKENKEFQPSSFEKMKRKAASFFHYCFWIPPLIVYNTLNKLLYDLFYKQFKKNIPEPHLFLSQKESIFIAALPPFVNRHAWEKHLEWIESALEHENVIIDFSHVRHINPSGMGLIYNIWKRFRATNKNLFFMGMNGDIECLLKLHGAWDILAASVTKGPDEVLQRMSINRPENLMKTREFLSIDQKGNQTRLSFFGKIQGIESHSSSGFQLDSVIIGRSLVINLDYCTSISNLGYGFLLHLRSMQKKQNEPISIENASSFLKNKFKYYNLDSYFKFI